MEENKELQNEQIIEVDFDKDLVDRYKREYIMEEEGRGADPEAEPYDTQEKLNEVPLEEMIEEGEVIIDDKNN
jgi:hypothetical protein